jgi:hypothetical protein
MIRVLPIDSPRTRVSLYLYLMCSWRFTYVCSRMTSLFRLHRLLAPSFMRSPTDLLKQNGSMIHPHPLFSRVRPHIYIKTSPLTCTLAYTGTWLHAFSLAHYLYDSHRCSCSYTHFSRPHSLIRCWQICVEKARLLWEQQTWRSRF